MTCSSLRLSWNPQGCNSRISSGAESWVMIGHERRFLSSDSSSDSATTTTNNLYDDSQESDDILAEFEHDDDEFQYAAEAKGYQRKKEKEQRPRFDRRRENGRYSTGRDWDRSSSNRKLAYQSSSSSSFTSSRHSGRSDFSKRPPVVPDYLLAGPPSRGNEKLWVKAMLSQFPEFKRDTRRLFSNSIRERIMLKILEIATDNEDMENGGWVSAYLVENKVGMTRADRFLRKWIREYYQSVHKTHLEGKGLVDLLHTVRVHREPFELMFDDFDRNSTMIRINYDVLFKRGDGTMLQTQGMDAGSAAKADEIPLLFCSTGDETPSNHVKERQDEVDGLSDSSVIQLQQDNNNRTIFTEEQRANIVRAIRKLKTLDGWARVDQVAKETGMTKDQLPKAAQGKQYSLFDLIQMFPGEPFQHRKQGQSIRIRLDGPNALGRTQNRRYGY